MDDNIINPMTAEFSLTLCISNWGSGQKQSKGKRNMTIKSQLFNVWKLSN